jgi:hypothetical protein
MPNPCRILARPHKDLAQKHERFSLTFGSFKTVVYPLDMDICEEIFFK